MTRTLSNPTLQSGTPSDWWGMPRLPTRNNKHNKSHHRLFIYNFIVPYANAVEHADITLSSGTQFISSAWFSSWFIPSLTRMHFYYCAMIFSFKQSISIQWPPFRQVPGFCQYEVKEDLLCERPAIHLSSIMYAERASQLLGNNNS